MRFIISILLFFLSFGCCLAQDSAVHLSASMFDKIQGIQLNLLDGWRFHPGHNPAWANPGIDTIGWKRMKPMDVSKKMVDKNGRIEGWFRLTIWLDSSFENIPLYLGINERGASDTYIDGNLFESYGNTGINGNAFKTPERTIKPDLSPIYLALGKEHAVAIHFVNYVPHFPLNLIEWEAGTYPLYPILSGPATIPHLKAYYEESGIYEIVTITICFVLSLLFWLLVFQNPREANLRLIALCTSLFGMAALLSYINLRGKFTLAGIITIAAFLDLFYTLLVLVLLTILAKIFTNKVPRKLLIFLCIISVINFYSLVKGHLIPLLITAVIVTFTALYYLVSSWKTLKGAQWAIAAGVILTFFWGVIWTISQFYFVPGIPVISYREAVSTGIIISFPLSLLLYVSIRFREIIRDVQENASRLVQVTEEKKQQALNQQKILEEEVKKQTADLRDTLSNLRSTQAQLIQSEKMASLGELTAGIAHEIQNPLNFVNNFSEVNQELIDELEGERSKMKSERNEVLENEIISDLKQNLEKINHHGKRADAIVKGMLQHSRSSTGIKEPSNINGLVDEYLRLAYHGLRAKDKSFNATLDTNYDESIGNINIIPQDIGRVLLNLYNNAFYAVAEKKKLNGDSYEPIVSVSTKKIDDRVLLSVNDNGNGIPQKILDKIFQPFFTTKPTGQGTGLGLSLSYDIIKAHGGEIKVETKEGEGTVFIIQLSNI